MASLLVWMEQDPGKEQSVPMIARRAGRSTRTLSRRFREQIGETPARWVTGARVRRARRLLETTALSVDRVAADAGFGSPAMLRERFGRLVGTSPQTYRRSFRAV